MLWFWMVHSHQYTKDQGLYTAIHPEYYNLSKEFYISVFQTEA